MHPWNEKSARKWMWVFLAALLAFQLYFVRELLAALLLFTVGIAALTGLVAAFFLFERAREASAAWIEPRTRVIAGAARRGLVVLEDLSKKPFRRLRSQLAR